MTEASWLTNEQAGVDQTSNARRQPLQPKSQDAAFRWAERLREVTVKARARKREAGLSGARREGGRVRRRRRRIRFV